MTATPLMNRCRSCDHVFDAVDAPLRCPSCQAVTSPHPQASPFALLGTPLAFVQDANALEQAWLSRTRQVHPDRFAKKPDVERRAAAEQSAAINDAWRTLKEPFGRAVWLLKSRGVVEPALPQARLFALMEAREEAEESAAGKARVIGETVARFEAIFAVVQQRLAAVDALGWSTVAPAELAPLAAQLAELRTLARLSADLGGPVLAALAER